MLPLLVQTLVGAAIPTLLGYSNGTQNLADVVVVDGLAYAVGNVGLIIYDTKSLGENVVGVHGASGAATGVALSQDIAYVVGGRTLTMLNVSSPGKMSVLGRHTTTNAMLHKVAVSGDVAYIATDRGALMMNVSNPEEPSRIGWATATGPVHDVVVKTDSNTRHLFLAMGASGFAVVDVTDENKPVNVRVVNSTPGPAVGIAIAKRPISGQTLVFIACGTGGLAVYIDSNLNGATMYADANVTSVAVSVDGKAAFVADSRHGVLVIDTDPIPLTSTRSLQVAGRKEAAGTVPQGLDFVEETNNLMVAYDSGSLHNMSITSTTRPSRLVSNKQEGHVEAIHGSGSTLFVGNNGELQIWELQRKNLQLLGSVRGPKSFSGSIQVYNNQFVFASYNSYLDMEGHGLMVFDVSMPSQPRFVSEIPGVCRDGKLVLRESVLYCTSFPASLLYIIDVGTGSPNVTATAYVGKVSDFDVSANSSVYLFQESSEDGSFVLDVLDVSDSTDPVNVTSLVIEGSARSIAVSGSTVFITNWEHVRGMLAVDVSNPSNPVVLGNYTGNNRDLTFYFEDAVACGDNTLCVTLLNGVGVFDVSKPLEPRLVLQLYRDYESNTQGTITHYSVSQNIMYAADSLHNILAYNMEEQDPAVVLIRLNINRDARDVTAVGDAVYVADRNAGLLIYNAADDDLPLTRQYQMPEGAHGVAVSGTTAYVVSTNGGLSTLDLRSTPPRLMGNFRGANKAVAVAVEGTVAYVADGDGVVLVNVQFPSNPTQLGRFNTNGMAVDVHVSGTTVYVADSAGGLRVLDASTPSAVREVGAYQDINAQAVTLVGNEVFLVGDVGLVVLNAANLSSLTVSKVLQIDGPTDVSVEGDLVYVGMADGVTVVNVSSQIPVVEGVLQTPGSPAAVHAAAGNRVLVADIGLWMFGFPATRMEPSADDDSSVAVGVYIAVGVVGGVALIALLGAAWFFCTKKEVVPY